MPSLRIGNLSNDFKSVTSEIRNVTKTRLMRNDSVNGAPYGFSLRYALQCLFFLSRTHKGRYDRDDKFKGSLSEGLKVDRSSSSEEE